MNSILGNIDLSLPVTNPVLIFALVLFALLLSPLIQQKLHVPSIISLILFGVVLGEHGLNVLSRDESFELFGSVGLAYIMFLAGLEMDLTDFMKNRKAGISFGLLTFFIPMIIGVCTSLALLSYLPLQEVVESRGQAYGEMTGIYYIVIASVLLASMYASHTLISYPIVSKYGVGKNRSVGITVGGTMITTTISLLILAMLIGMVKGDINGYFWVRMGLSVCIFLFAVGYVFPKVACIFFKLYDDSITQYILVLALVFFGGFLAQVAGLESIIGAFLVGVAINNLIPKVSPLMNRLEFVGNAIFIPFFLMGVGMMINIGGILESPYTIVTAIVMCIVATSSKYLAAMSVKRMFGMNKDEGLMIFGLSNSQAAATLAAVKIGYDTIIFYSDTGQHVRIFSDDILNGTIVMILFTCTIASLVTEKSAKSLALATDTLDEKLTQVRQQDRILVPLANPESVATLMEVAVLIRQKKSKQPLYVLHVVTEDQKNGKDLGRRLLEKAARIASATDNYVKMISRYDEDAPSGIVNAVKENEITEVVMGLHHQKNVEDNFFGAKAMRMIQNNGQMLMVVKVLQPLNTIKRVLIVVPNKAEFEVGFVKWYDRVKNLCKQIGAKAVFFGTEQTLTQIKILAQRNLFGVPTTYDKLTDWEDFLIMTGKVQSDDLMVVVTSRHNAVSFNPLFEKLPSQLAKYFAGNSFIVLYPEQTCVMPDKEMT